MSAVVCIRRESARWGTCTCPDCVVNRRRLQKLRRCGRFVPARSGEAWARVDDLLAAGWTAAAIADAAGLRARGVRAALDRRKRHGAGTWSAYYADRLLAIPPGAVPDAGYVSVLGPRRRLRALACLGHTIPAVHRAMLAHGIPAPPVPTLHAIRNGQTPDHVRGPSAESIRRVYDLLCMVPAVGHGTTASRLKAQRSGWLPPLAYDCIDDPGEQPDTAPRARSHRDIDMVRVARMLNGRPCPGATVAEREAAVRALHVDGLHDRLIADRLGITERSVGRIRRRLGLPAIPYGEGQALRGNL